VHPPMSRRSHVGKLCYRHTFPSRLRNMTAERHIAPDALLHRSTIAGSDTPNITIGSVSPGEYASGVQKLVQDGRQSGIPTSFRSDSALMAQFFGSQSERNQHTNISDDRVVPASQSQSMEGAKPALPNPPLRACELPPVRKDVKNPIRQMDKHCPTPPWRKDYRLLQPGDPEPIG
jgi:hypothetical protein